MNIKSIILSSVVGITSIFGGVSEAKAQTCFDLPYSAGGGAICNTYRGQTRDGYSLYRLGYYSDGYKSGMDVVCNGQYMVRWQSNSNMSHSYNTSLANYFCSL